MLEPIDWSTAHTTFTESSIPKGQQTCAAYVVVQDDGSFKTMSSPDKPWLCWKLGKKVDFKPTPTNFE